MPRILGIDLPKEKRIEAALPYIYGIGPAMSRKILDEAKVSYDKRAKDLSEEEVSRITSILQKGYRTEGDLRREITQNIKRLIDIGSYRGMRHKKGLPARGQRTKTNARTRKGKRRMIASIPKATEKA
ncbi:MAG: 30S ribosomal protein S13 [Candidatus Omnitrophota bacterium]